MPLTRREFLSRAVLGAGGAAVLPGRASAEPAAAPAAPGSPLNVLFIAVDDMNVDLGCYGRAQAHTPNLDRLAREGVAFQRAYCQYPLCSPSRTSVMTGLRPDALGVFDLAEHFRWSRPDAITLPQLFRRHGYAAVRAGKIYHYGNPGDIGTQGLDDPLSWNYAINPMGRDKLTLEPDVVNYTPEHGSKLRRTTLGSSIAFLNDREGVDAEHTDGKVTAAILAQLEANRDRPFFLAAGFYRPHCPYMAPKRYFDFHPLDGVTVPEVAPGYPETVPAAALASTHPWPVFGVSSLQAREAAQAYAASISFVDAQVGRLLDALERLRLRERTVVVFWSDHGQHLGDHGLWFKNSLFDKSARVPLIIAAPGKSGNGRPCVRPVELLDIYPTLAELCGLPAPAALEGASLAALLENPDGAWTRPAFTQIWRQAGQYSGHSVQTERFRYSEWDEGRLGVELYDLQSDPGEMANLATHAEFRGTVEELAGLLRANWKTSFRPVRGDFG